MRSPGDIPRIQPYGLILDFDGYIRQGGRVLPVVVRAEQQFQAAGQQDPDVSLSAAAVTARGGSPHTYMPAITGELVLGASR